MQSRRSFLAAAGLAASVAARAASPPWKLATGLNGFGSSEQYHGKKYDYDEILKFTRDEGFQGIEAWRNWREGYPEPGDEAGIRAMRKKVEDYGLQIFSIQAGGPRGVNPLSADSAEQKKYTDALKSYVDLALKLGCDAMGLWQGGRAGGLAEDELIERFAAVIKPAARYAVDQGIFMAIEGEPPLLINSAARYHKPLRRGRYEGVQSNLRPQPFRRSWRRQGQTRRPAARDRRRSHWLHPVLRRGLDAPPDPRRTSGHLQTPALRSRKVRHRITTQDPARRRVQGLVSN